MNASTVQLPRMRLSSYHYGVFPEFLSEGGRVIVTASFRNATGNIHSKYSFEIGIDETNIASIFQETKNVHDFIADLLKFLDQLMQIYSSSNELLLHSFHQKNSIEQTGITSYDDLLLSKLYNCLQDENINFIDYTNAPQIPFPHSYQDHGKVYERTPGYYIFTP